MKKIVLSLAGVLAATAFAPEASAVPAFARQTGMACNACHFQHFPVMNAFGRAFKASGYTMMGAQGKIEGDHLSLPDTLNMSMLTKIRYQKTSGSDAAGAISGVDSKNDGQWQFPDEFVFLIGGRVADNIGVMMELGMGGSFTNTQGSSGGGMMGIFKLPFVWDMGGAKLGITPFLTDSQGVFTGYDMASSGQVRASRWMEDRGASSSQNFTGIGAGAATGIAFSANSDMGYIAWSRVSPNHASTESSVAVGGAAGLGAQEYKTNVVRIAATPTVGDWALHIGAGFVSGDNYATAGDVVATAADLKQVKGQTLDFQAQGQLGGKDTSFYVNYAKAPGTAVGGRANYFNNRVTDKKAWVIAGDYSVIPHVLSIGAGYRNAHDGGNAGQADTNNAFFITGVYDLYQNVALHLNHTMQSGSAYNVGGTKAGNMVAGGAGKNVTTLMLEAAW